MAEIEVLVLAYNRESLIAQTIESLLAQSVPACRICVLDNGSTDRTAEIVETFAVRGVELVRRATNDARACWSDLQSLARGPWTILFHDDDLLHPRYIEHVREAIRLNPEATVVVSGMKSTRNPCAADWECIQDAKVRRLTARQLATRLYAGFAMPFCSAVYRTEILKRAEISVAIYGKIFDRPLVLDIARRGCALLLPRPYVQYRLHAQQDSCDAVSGPYLDQVIALQRMYLELLGDSPWRASGRIFLRRNLRNLRRDFFRLKGVVAGEDSGLLQLALKEGATSCRAIRVGKLYGFGMLLPRKIESVVRRALSRVRHALK